ncbi:MAG: hypothetical protein AAGC60_18710 [Acidobacteriota bacterium]
MDAVFILGMHRSGTSCLASCLEACGLYLGAVNRRAGAADNPYGTFEPLEVNEINERILGSWIRPRLPPRPKTREIDEIDACVAQLEERARRAGETRIGLKDPRMLLLLPLWRDRFDRVEYVASYRSAEAVHRSIKARGELRTWRRANLRAWRLYNQALVDLCARETVALISFELEATAYRERLNALCGHLDLTYDDDAVRTRFDPSVRRQPTTPSRKPEIAALESELERLARGAVS